MIAPRAYLLQEVECFFESPPDFGQLLSLKEGRGALCTLPATSRTLSFIGCGIPRR